MTRSGVRLDPDQTQFVQGGVSVIAASADARRVPSLARALGCRVECDGDEIVLCLIAARAAALLDDLRAGRPVAVTVTRPSTHRTLQIKSSRAVVAPALADDAAHVARYIDDFVAEAERTLGAPIDAVARAALGRAGEVDTRVRLRPEALFEQTPGPRAGQCLAAA